MEIPSVMPSLGQCPPDMPFAIVALAGRGGKGSRTKADDASPLFRMLRRFVTTIEVVVGMTRHNRM
eukprot:scaffold34603_cov212-Amphora_coffeaeformis.AAC.2